MTIMKTEYYDHIPLAPLATPAQFDEAADRPCDTARFSPFGFRIHARPGRQPRFFHRGFRGNQTGRGNFLQAIKHH